MSEERLRVLYVMGRGTLGGIERHVQAIVRNLDRSRFTPSVVILFDGGPVEQDLGSRGVAVHALGGRSGSAPALAWRLWRTIRAARPDVIHSHELHAAIGLCMRIIPALPWIHTEHCSFEHGPSPEKARLLWNLFGGRLTTILAVSRATGDSLHEHTGIPRSRIDTIFNGLDISSLPPKDPTYARRALGLPEAASLIGSVGRLAWQKGWPDFLACASHLAAAHPEMHFLVVGDGPERIPLDDEVHGRGLAGRIHFLGAREDAVSLIGGLDLFVLTSRHEEMPTTLLEAFAMRTPVAGFLPQGGVAEVLELSDSPPAALMDDRNPAALAETIGRLLANPEERESMIAAAAQLVDRHFSMGEITRLLERRYLDARRSSSRPN